MKEITLMRELKEFLNENEEYNINVVCTRKDDDYILIIQAYSTKPNNEAMLIFKKVESSITFSISIDSFLLSEAYSNLSEEDKIPAVHEINDLTSALDGEYMRLIVKVTYLKIMENLKKFNDKKDDYNAIAKIASRHRGMVFAYISGLEKEEFI
jgi:hypothetical protein